MNSKIDFGVFQREASRTSQLELGGPRAAIAPMLGLASEAGSILDVYKRYLQGRIELGTNREFLQTELGDLLWYAAAIATAVGLDLQEVAEANLRRTQDLYPLRDAPVDLATLPVLDAAYPDHERFPRQLAVEFSEQKQATRVVTTVTLASATPNFFGSGPVMVGEQLRGFTLGSPLGDPLTDNSRVPDAYRYHDAIHLGFLAVLGWSPMVRKLLGLRRWSNGEVNEYEDGARARYAEEGLAAVLARLAKRRSHFHDEISVDSDAIDAARAATDGLEVSTTTAWLWRRAISRGFVAMETLAKNEGGFLIVDLDARELTYRKVL